jgi:hypothetical protein
LSFVIRRSSVVVRQSLLVEVVRGQAQSAG